MGQPDIGSLVNEAEQEWRGDEKHAGHNVEY